jgi:diguanylate cyclase (GGDEF)-like protein/PAS domain S-box-containing protein
LDLRPALAVERRTAPALFLLSALVALGAAPVATLGAGGLWVWAGLVAGNAALRFLLATAHQRMASPVRTHAPVARGLAVSHGVDLVLWGALLLALLPAERFVVAAGFGAAGAVVLAAFSLGTWPRAWTAYVAGWAIVTALAAVRGGSVAAPFAFAFALWLGAVWWLGRALVRETLDPEKAQQATLDGRTRIGWRQAVVAMPNPVLIVRAGRITDLNSAAARLIGRDERSLLGTRIDEALRCDPPHAFDPQRAPSDQASVVVTPLGRTFEPGVVWTARVRVLAPGKADSVVVIAPMQTSRSEPAADPLAEDAARLVHWVGALGALPWYRGEDGRVFLPALFGAGAGPDASADSEFPLAAWVPQAQRAAIDADYRHARRRGGVFDRAMFLLDSAGRPGPWRVVCIARPASDGKSTPVVGVLAPAAAVDCSLPAPGELVARLPVLTWLVDGGGRLLAVYGAEGWRWGMREKAAPGRDWQQAFTLREDSLAAVRAAIDGALKGKPGFDVVNSRVTARGGRVVLRSHFVPHPIVTAAGSAPGALVLDTVASPQQLEEIDRLRRRNAQYQALIDASTSLIWACDSRFVITYASRRAARDIYGCDPADLVGRSLASLLHPDVDQRAAKHALARLRTGEPLRDVEMVQVAGDGRRVVVSVNAAPLKGGDGAFGGAIGMNADLTMLKQRERRLTEALRIERTVLDAAGQAIAVVKDGLVVRCNDAFLALLGAQPAQLARTPVAQYFAAPEAWSELVRAADSARAADRAAVREVQVRRGGAVPAAWCQITARAIAAGEQVIVLADIDHIRHREAEALHHAHHDELTGLPNRRLLSIRAAQALAASGPRMAPCAVIAIDLDGFKEVNDRYGHGAGDAVLQEMAVRLTRVMRPQDTVARRGGDEFALLVPDVGGPEDAARIAERVLRAIEQPVRTPAGNEARLSASLGIALAPEHGRELERLLQAADHAMYDAKLRGKNRYAFVTTAAAAVSAEAPRAARAS